MPVPTTLAGLSSTDSANSPPGSEAVGTSLDDYLRAIQGIFVRGLSHKGSDIASATTTDIGAVEGLSHDITGTTTITGFGTVRAGIIKILKFEGVLTITHNATSLILKYGLNHLTTDGDVIAFASESSGNWREIWRNVAGGDVIPGAVMDDAGATAPAGWLHCYGQAISRTTYSALFSRLSTDHGVGDNSTTFNLPDLRGRVIAGQDDMGGSSANRLTGVTGSVNGDTFGAAGGEEAHALTLAENGPHTHSYVSPVGATGAFALNAGAALVESGGSAQTSGSSGSGTAHNNVQPTIILNKMIKT